MTEQQERLIAKMKEIKQSATMAGHEFLQMNLPIPLGKELNSIVNPFIKIEKGCDAAIRKIKNLKK